MPVVIRHRPRSEQATSGLALKRPGGANLWVSSSPSSHGFASPPNMVMMRTFGATGGSSAATGRERAAMSAAARTMKREIMAGSCAFGSSYRRRLGPAAHKAKSKFGQIQQNPAKPAPSCERIGIAPWVRVTDPCLLIWKVFDVSFGSTAYIKSPTTGERHDIASASSRSGLFAEAPVGVAGNLLLSFPDRGLHERGIERG